MDRYGNIIETDPKNNHKIFDGALNDTVTIDKYFEQNDDCIYYADNVNHPYTAYHIIINA